MSNQNAPKPLSGPTGNWNHAGELFTADNHALSPKVSFLYHVFFELNPVALVDQTVSDTKAVTELGMLVKQVGLPKFTVDTKVLNAYNRPHVIQNKIRYDPVTLQFHDDSSNVVQKFWADYYTYYYRDSDPTNEALFSAHSEITEERKIKDWGYTVRGSPTSASVEPYILSIKIYSLFKKKFTCYTLINPIIKSFQHGEHVSSDSNLMQHVMSVDYESIKYTTGDVDPNAVTGFGDLHYSPFVSPTLNNSQCTPEGMPPENNVMPETPMGMCVPGGSQANHDGFRSILSGANTNTMTASQAMSLGRNILASSNNPFSTVRVPVIGNMMTGSRVSGIPQVPMVTSFPGMSGIPGVTGGMSVGVSTGPYGSSVSLGGGLNIGGVSIGGGITMNSNGTISGGIRGSTNVGGLNVGGGVGVDSRGMVTGSVMARGNISGNNGRGYPNTNGMVSGNVTGRMQTSVYSQSGIQTNTAIGGIARMPVQTRVGGNYYSSANPNAYQGAYGPAPSMPSNLIAAVTAVTPNLAIQGIVRL